MHAYTYDETTPRWWEDMAMRNDSSIDRMAVIYDRASRPQQANNYSRDDAARLYELAERKGMRWELRREVKSGEHLSNRPVMRKLLDDIESGRVGAIVCQDFSRLSRDQDGIDGRIIRMICRDSECVIMTPEKTYDFSMDADDDMADIHFLAAKVQKRENVRALVRGMMEKARQGKMLPTSALFGYRWDRVDEEGHKIPGAMLVIDDDEARVVRLIFDLYERMSQFKIARYLNENGYRLTIKSIARKSRSGKPERLFTTSDVGRMIQMKLYAGVLTWCEKPRSRFTMGQEATCHHLPELQIVSLEQFNRCQEIREQRYRTPSRSIFSPFIFSGVLRCIHCGMPTVGMRQIRKRGRGERHEYRLYACRAYHTMGKTACRGQMVSENLVKRAVVPFLVELLTRRLDLRRYIQETAEGMQAPVEEKLERNRVEIAEAEAGMNRLDDAIVAGAITMERARAKNLELMEKKERAERQLEALRGRRELSGELATAVALLSDNMGWVIETLPDEALSKLCKLVFRRVVVGVSGSSHRKGSWIEAYEFTPEFADLVAHSTQMVDLPGCNRPFNEFDTKVGLNSIALLRSNRLSYWPIKQKRRLKAASNDSIPCCFYPERSVSCSGLFFLCSRKSRHVSSLGT
jgi:site-specific DNA recombinase